MAASELTVETEVVIRRCSGKKVSLRNFAKFTGKHLCQSLFFTKVPCLRAVISLKKTLVQVFSSKFCKIAKNTFFHRIVAASVESNCLELSFWTVTFKTILTW